MLKKTHRLPSSIRLTNARYYKTADFSVRIAKNDAAVSRFGFIVRKSVDKRATARNRARRVLRSCIEEMLPAITKGQDMLFSLEKGIIGKSREEVCGEVTKLLTEKKLLKQI